MPFFFRSNFLPSLFKRRNHHDLSLLRPNAAPRRSLLLPITAAAVVSAAGVAYITYTSYADRPLRSFQVPPPPLGLLPPTLEKVAARPPDSLSDLTGPRLLLHDRVLSLIKSRDLDSAAAALRSPDAPRPHVCTCNKLMEAMLVAKRPEDAISLFNSSTHAGVVPDTDTYDVLIAAYQAAGREADFGVCYLILRLGHAETVSEMISLYRISDAIDVLRATAVWPHLAAGSVLHHVIVHRGVDIDRVAKLFDEIERRYKLCDHDLHSSVKLYSPPLISPFMYLDQRTWSLGRIFALLKWVWRRGEKSKEVARFCYSRLLDWGLYQSMLDPTALNALLRDLLEHGGDRVAIANILFDKMLKSHNPPSLVTVNAETCDIMVNHRFKEGRAEEAVKIFRSIWEKENVIDVGSLDNLVGKLREDGRASDAKKLYDEMPTLSVRTVDHASIIARSFREERPEDALRYFRKMLHAHEGFDLRLYTKVVYGLVNAGRFDEALRVLGLARVDTREMTEQGLDPAEPGFGLGQAARKAIEVLYPQH